MQSIANFCGNQHIGFPRVANTDGDFFCDRRAVPPKVGELGRRGVTSSRGCDIAGSPTEGSRSVETSWNGGMHSPRGHGVKSSKHAWVVGSREKVISGFTTCLFQVELGLPLSKQTLAYSYVAYISALQGKIL
jgi:hypothetical protein